MRNLQRIADAVMSQPWFMTPTQMQIVQDQLRAAMLRPQLAADDVVGPMAQPREGGQPYPLAQQVQTIGDIAVLPLHGMLGKYLSNFALQCGGCDLHLAHQQLENIANDDSIKIVILDLDTPGGQARGVPKFAQAVSDLTKTKTVIAFAQNLMASAGYFIGSAADMIVTTDDALVGSISTVMAGIDDHRRWETAGYERKLFVTGQYKSIGMSGTAWTEEQITYLNERIGKVDAEFKDFVRARRKLPDEMMQGQTWEAREVIGSLVDETTESMEALLMELLA